jgi:outer membrane protein insertion porin family
MSAPRALLIVLAVLAQAVGAFAQGGAPIVSRILIAGNQRVESDAIRIHISQQAGQRLDENEVKIDVKAIHNMGFFEMVAVERQPQPSGSIVLLYRVKERPELTDVRFYGMKAVRSDDVNIVAAIKVHPGSIIDPTAVKKTIDAVTQVYEDKGYLDAKVTFKAIPQPDNTTFAEFDVVEGP